VAGSSECTAKDVINFVKNNVVALVSGEEIKLCGCDSLTDEKDGEEDFAERLVDGSPLMVMVIKDALVFVEVDIALGLLDAAVLEKMIELGVSITEI
jgi:hypothetical protein